MQTKKLVDTPSKSLPKLKVKTLVHILTDMLNKVAVGTHGFTLTKKQVKALVNTLAGSRKEVDFETLRNTLIKVQALPRSNHVYTRCKRLFNKSDYLLKIVRSTMENSTLRDCLSYDSTLNYLLWSSNVDSLKILVSEILMNTAIASAEVNEVKHHKMVSFKAADCIIKLYTTTKKIIIQGSGSTSLTKAFSDFLNVKDNGYEAMNSNNGGQQSEASAADEHIETYAIEQLDPTDALTTTSQDEVKSDLQLIKEEIKRMKNDISYILNNDGKINISSAGASDNLNFKLQEENNLLRYQLKVAKDNLAELKEVIGTLESEEPTLISTIRILQRNDLKLSQEEAYNFTAVDKSCHAIRSSHANKYLCC